MSLRHRLSLAAASFALAAAGAIAQQPYQLLNPPQPTEGGGKVEVIEFFWYGCPHCYSLEPNVAAWSKKTPPDVVFKRVHALPSDAWAEHGFAAVAKQYLQRLPRDKSLRSIDENGDLLVRRPGKVEVERGRLARKLGVPSWLDPATRGPRA